MKHGLKNPNRTHPPMKGKNIIDEIGFTPEECIRMYEKENKTLRYIAEEELCVCYATFYEWAKKHDLKFSGKENKGRRKPLLPDAERVKINNKMKKQGASIVAIDAYGAEELPSDVPGRAIFKTHELTHLQVPYISDEEMWKRLEVYQNVIEYREEVTETGDDFREYD